MPSLGEPPLPDTHSGATRYSPHRYHFSLLNNLAERFAKSSTPGGQGVNTTDGKVQLSIDVAECASLTDAQRHRISRNLEHRLDGSVFTVTASTQRSVFR